MQDDLNLFRELTELLLQTEINQPVAKPIKTKELYQELDIELSNEPSTDSDFKKSLENLIVATPKTASKSFFNQLFGGRMSRSTLGDLLAVMLNNSMYTYKVAGAQVGIEKELLKQIASLAGYSENFGGTFAPGGSMSNYMSVLMARDKYNPSIKLDGVSKKLCLYTSEASHYSVKKNASFIGIGRNQVRSVKTDDEGRMLVDDLERLIKKDLSDGFHPFYVNATAGTTVLGAFDDIRAISGVCKTYNLWLHVDGAYCGSVVFSKKYKYLVDGLELSDSFSVNAHKMLGTPLTCSIILTNDKSYLYESFSNDAEYLYQTADDEFNLGKTSLQCGRRNDALKLWTLWKSIGTNGLEHLVDHQFEMADIARNYIKAHKDYKLHSFDNSVSVCFTYKDLDPETLCTSLYKYSQLLVGFGTFQEKDFVRLVTVNSSIIEEDVLDFFKTLEAFVASGMLEKV